MVIIRSMNKLSVENNYSRVVEYKINEKNMTIEQIWEYSKDRKSELYVGFVGSAYELDNRNILMDFGGIIREREDEKATDDLGYSDKVYQTTYVIEVDPKDNTIVWEMTFLDEMKKISNITYRA